jgi:hypothetical protein
MKPSEVLQALLRVAGPAPAQIFTVVLPKITVMLIGATLGLGASDARAAYASWVYPAQDGRLLYKRDSLGNRVPDFAGAGYHGGAVPIPNVPVRVAVQPIEGDDTGNIQAAINQMASLPLDESGFRGAVLLIAGDYQVGGQLIINTSGIVLRGDGDSQAGTVLHATGVEKRTLIVVRGGDGEDPGPENQIAESYVPVGMRSFNMQSFNQLSDGATVRVHRPSPTNWLQDIDMWELDWEYVPGPLGGMRRVHKTGEEAESWQAGGMDLFYERTITRIEGKRVFLDAPITCALEQRYGGGTIQRYERTGRIQHIGIEHIRGDSDFLCVPTAACKDENHAQSFIEFADAQHCWVRDVTAAHFVFACVTAGPGTKWLTVADSESLNPVSRVDGGRRYAFHLAGAEYCLIRNCRNRFDRHQFATSERTHGPNVFVDGLSEEAHDECGPHARWATAGLWDNILVASAGSIVNEGSWLDIAELNLRNRGNFGTGQGWAGANCVAWNTFAVNGSDVDSPPTARNWAIGSYRPLIPTMFNPNPGVNGSGAIEVRQTPAFPSSLYHAQMQDAMDAPQLQVREYVMGDFDRFTPNGDATPIDSAWRAALGGAVDGFDVLAGNHIIGWTHTFQLDPGDTIESATLSIALRRTGGQPDDDIVYLNSLADARPLSSFADSISSSDATVIVIDLASKLPELYASRFNVAVLDDMSVDWSILELRVAPSFPRLTTTILPEADGTVRNGDDADVNFGSATNLVVKEDSDDGFDRRAFIRWDLSQVRGQVVHAKVRLLPIFVGEDDIENAASIATSDAWTEGTLNWNNQPGADYRFASWVPKAGQPVEFNVTPHVAAALASDRKLTIRLHSVRDVGDSGGVEYTSREYPGRAVQPSLFVTVTNSAPFISDITNRIVLPGASTGPIAFTIGDNEQTTFLAVTSRSDNQTVVPNGSIVLGGTGTNRTITIMPSLSYTGAVTITVFVSDGIQTNSDDFVVVYLPTVPPPNAYVPPRIAAIADVTINEDESTGPIPFTFFARPAGLSPRLLVSAYSSNTMVVPSQNVVLGGTGSNRMVTVTPAPNANGDALITVRVFDGLWETTESFLVRVRPVPDPPSVAQLIQPAPGSLFSVTDIIHLVADARDPDNDLVGVDFLVNGQRIGIASRSPLTWDWPPAAPGVYSFAAVARDATGNSLTSAPIVAVVQPRPETLIPLSGEWRYFDSNAPLASWMAPGFDDASWLTGFAPIGLDDERCETVLNPASTQITTFFRNVFLVSDPANFAQLLLRLYSPQGAVIYLNGGEVFRRYLPPGPMSPDTVAVISASDGKIRPTENLSLPPTSLLSGSNILAVELHRHSQADPTFSFDLELVGYAATALPRLDIARQQNNVTLRWPDWSRAYFLESTPSLIQPARWKPVTNTPIVIANEQSLTLPTTNAAQLFRLHRP